MAIERPKQLQVLEGPQIQRRGEGLVYKIDLVNLDSSPTPSSATITIIQKKDGTDVTSAWMAVNTPSIATTVITLDEILIPATARIDDYIVDVEFEAGGYSPGTVWFLIQAKP